MSREVKKRHGLLVLITMIVWTMIAIVIFFVDPAIIRDMIIPGSYLLMGLLLFLGIYLLLSIIFLSAKRSLRWTVGIMIFIYLRIYGLGTPLNAVLIAGFLLSIEGWYTLNR